MSKDEQPTRGGFVPESSDSYPRILPEKPLLINGFSGRARRMAAGSPSQRQEPSEGVSGKQPGIGIGGRSNSARSRSRSRKLSRPCIKRSFAASSLVVMCSM